MVKQYKLMRVPMEAVKGLELKRHKMESRIKSWTGKTVRIPMTRILTAVANNPTELEEHKIIRLTKKKVKRVKIK